MNQRVRNAHVPSPRTGSFATRRGLLRAKGTGASSLRLVGFLALALAASLALAAPSALAARTHVFKESFASPGSGAGQLSLVPGGEASPGSGLAVNDSTHDVYVADTGNHRIDQFSSTGAFIRAFGWGVADGSAELQTCTATCQAGISGSAPGQLEAPTFLAVDNAPGGEGDLYVADTADHLITKFQADGTLVGTWGNNGAAEAPNGQLAGKTQAEPFERIAGIAVDSAGNLDVLRRSPESVVRFTRAGVFLEALANPRGNAEVGLAVDASGNFFKANGEPSAEKFEPNGGESNPGFGQVSSSTTAVGLAVDPSSGELFLDTGLEIEAFAFSPSGEVTGTGCTPVPEAGCPPSGTFGAAHLSGGAGLAVDGSSGDLYAASTAAGQIARFEAAILPDPTTEAAADIGAHEATLHGTISAAGGPQATCRFQYTTEAVFETNGFQGAATAPCAPAGPFTGATSEAVSAIVTGLAAGTPYVFRLVGENEVGTNAALPLEFETLGPQVLAESVTEVSATTATLEAELNPHGLPTTYHFEFDTAPYTEGGPAHGTSAPIGSAGEGETDVLRTARLEGLAPATTYHFRVLATNALGTAEGPDRAFTTQPAAASTLLPDSRAWELVSPPNKHGIPLSPLSEGLIQAATDGDALTYTALGSITEGAPGNTSLSQSQYIAHRATAGWSTQDITPPKEEPSGFTSGDSTEYKFFSPDLTRAALQPKGGAPLSPITTEPTPYLREPDGTYTPLVTAANAPTGVPFGGTVQTGSEVHFVSASPDLGSLIVRSTKPLTPELVGLPEKESLFEWSDGSLQLASWVPAGAEPRCGGSAPAACIPAAELGLESRLGFETRLVRGAVSADGSRLVFSTVGSSGKSLYLRDTATSETLRLDAAQGLPEPSTGAAAIFQTASADGSRVFFTDSNRLTADASTREADLYMCQVEETETPGGLACDLRDLSANALHPSEPAAVQGVPGASADGSSVYFAAQGALTADASPTTCGEAASDSCNLYRYDLASGELRLLGVLSGADRRDWTAGDHGFDLGSLTARVSPNGRYLAFMSERPLTGYDNRDALSGERDEEVFIYDAAANGGEGRLICASCNPTGARPRGQQEPPTFPYPLYDSPNLWNERWLAAAIPGWTQVHVEYALYQSRYLSDSGRLFFNAFDALSPADSNGASDVYQFEFPQGPGQPSSNDCTTSSPSYTPTSGGCVDLISSGTSGQESAFLDASETGDDVYFLNAARLDPGHDVDAAYDVYDARAPHIPGEVVGFPAPVKPVECSGDACQQPATPPNHPTPGTALVNGPGNVLQCPKGKVKKNGKCVKKHKAKKHHKKKGHKKQKRSNSNHGGQK